MGPRLPARPPAPARVHGPPPPPPLLRRGGGGHSRARRRVPLPSVAAGEIRGAPWPPRFYTGYQPVRLSTLGSEPVDPQRFQGSSPCRGATLVQQRCLILPSSIGFLPTFLVGRKAVSQRKLAAAATGTTRALCVMRTTRCRITCAMQPPAHMTRCRIRRVMRQRRCHLARREKGRRVSEKFLENTERSSEYFPQIRLENFGENPS